MARPKIQMFFSAWLGRWSSSWHQRRWNCRSGATENWIRMSPVRTGPFRFRIFMAIWCVVWCYMMVIWRLYDVIWWLYDGYMTVIWLLYDGYMMVIWWLYDVKVVNLMPKTYHLGMVHTIEMVMTGGCTRCMGFFDPWNQSTRRCAMQKYCTFYGYLWIFYGILWIFMEFYGYLWIFMDYGSIFRFFLHTLHFVFSNRRERWIESFDLTPHGFWTPSFDWWENLQERPIIYIYMIYIYIAKNQAFL